MFGFLKEPCSDMDLYGYLTQAVGGLINSNKECGRRFSDEDILKRIDLYLHQRKRKLDQRQQLLIRFAAELVTQYYYHRSGDETAIKRYCDRFAEMMVNFDFRDPAVEGLREELDRFVCTFKY